MINFDSERFGSQFRTTKNFSESNFFYFCTISSMPPYKVSVPLTIFFKDIYYCSLNVKLISEQYLNSPVNGTLQISDLITKSVGLS